MKLGILNTPLRDCLGLKIGGESSLRQSPAYEFTKRAKDLLLQADHSVAPLYMGSMIRPSPAQSLFPSAPSWATPIACTSSCAIVILVLFRSSSEIPMPRASLC